MRAEFNSMTLNVVFLLPSPSQYPTSGSFKQSIVHSFTPCISLEICFCCSMWGPGPVHHNQGQRWPVGGGVARNECMIWNVLNLGVLCTF